MKREARKRTHSLLKTLSWRVIATAITFISSFILTGEILLAAGIGGLDAAFKMVVYYGHERVWELVKR